MRNLIGFPTLVAPGLAAAWALAATVSAAQAWDYSDPAAWGTGTDTQNRICATGTEQSPIAVLGPTARPLTVYDRKFVDSISFDYRAMTLTLSDKGYNTEIEAEGAENAIHVDGLRYQLANIHFHHPAEHLRGQTEMEMHIVHTRTDNGKLRRVVVAVGVGAPPEGRGTFPPPQGPASAALAAFFGHLKSAAPAGATINPADLLPNDRTYFFRYSGSLTTPNCSEDVIWIVFRYPIEIAKAQVATFKAQYPMNARPLQTLNRHILLRCCWEPRDDLPGANLD
jgi:carbonic anhydrase